jgi:hypothetical protein
MMKWHAVGIGFALALAGAAHCGGSDNGNAGGTGGGGGSPEKTGQSCMSKSDCYPGIEAGALSGEVQCLSVTGGYCTHLCNDDSDCCKAAGECRTSLRQVCSPFESTGMKMCFLSCEDADIQAANAADASRATDSNVYCQTEASAAFTCRSTGGGAQNRKVCLPGGTSSPDASSPDASSPDASSPEAAAD